MVWETVIGLEIHAQLATASKIFSGSSTAFGAAPNVQACALDLGLPGTLPVFNGNALNMAIRFGLAIDAEIAEETEFARKNYFYPDLPKGYQTSQLDRPIVGRGAVTISLGNEQQKVVNITRAHLEEDAGKSVHDALPGATGIDLNRAGTPLLEIVSEPDMRSASEAATYMRTIHSLVRWIGICDGNMQEGSFRADANVSVRPAGSERLGTRTEIKNLNSFRFLERAIEFEVERQIEVIESGGSIRQETRLFDPDRGETRAMRSKEEAEDYRYFPCPDLLPVRVEAEVLERVRRELPELPQAKRDRFTQTLGLSAYDAEILTADRDVAEYFERVLATAGDAKLAANWVMGEVAAACNQAQRGFDSAPIAAESVGQLITRIADETISTKIAKTVFEVMLAEGGEPDDIIEARGLKQMSDSGALEALVDAVIAEHPGQVEQFRSGKEKLMGFFVGQVMKRTGGRANPGQVNGLLRDRLKADT